MGEISQHGHCPWSLHIPTVKRGANPAIMAPGMTPDKPASCVTCYSCRLQSMPTLARSGLSSIVERCQLIPHHLAAGPKANMYKNCLIQPQSRTAVPHGIKPSRGRVVERDNTHGSSQDVCALTLTARASNPPAERRGASGPILQRFR